MKPSPFAPFPALLLYHPEPRQQKYPHPEDTMPLRLFMPLLFLFLPGLFLPSWALPAATSSSVPGFLAPSPPFPSVSPRRLYEERLYRKLPVSSREARKIRKQRQPPASLQRQGKERLETRQSQVQRQEGKRPGIKRPFVRKKLKENTMRRPPAPWEESKRQGLRGRDRSAFRERRATREHIRDPEPRYKAPGFSKGPWPRDRWDAMPGQHRPR